jgi:hypothetical protein
MQNLIVTRDEIYDHFHASESCQDFFFSSKNNARYGAYYTSMYLLQDTMESLIDHRARGFCDDPLRRYIEFWGIMQALIIQQDSIAELFWAVTGSKLDSNDLVEWHNIRSLRNDCAGHPANRQGGAVRTFMGRGFGDYSEVSYERLESPDSISHPRVKLGAKIDDYANEVRPTLAAVLNTMKENWPT